MTRIAHYIHLIGYLLLAASLASCNPAYSSSPQQITRHVLPTDTASPPTAAALPTPFSTAVPMAMTAPPVAPTTVPLYTYEVQARYPHDPGAFTQGLVVVDGTVYEGTGLNGESSLRRVVLETGEVQQQINLDETYFGEGIAVVGERIFQLTWQSQVAFVYDRTSFDRITTFSYQTEGWGLTYNGEHLIMSDGTDTLYVRDPSTFEVVQTIKVRDTAGPVTLLNELEWVKGEIFANVWQTDRIARINPATGDVTGWVDLTGLLAPEDRTPSVDVLNGIAYDAAQDQLLVTGKRWPYVFVVALKPL